MKKQQLRSNHWSDEQLIDSLYALRDVDDHLATCAACQERLAAMRLSRERLDALSRVDEAGLDSLAAQRRAILAKIARPVRTPPFAGARLYLGSAAAALALCAGLFVYEHENAGRANQQTKISDAQLAEDVAQIADDPEPQATTPLHALFEE